MFRLSRASTYGARALAYVAQAGECSPQRVADIAAACKLPYDYLSKILQQLARAGLLRSERGRGGGFVLLRPASRISVLEILEAIDGPFVPTPAPAVRRGSGALAQARLERIAARAAAQAAKTFRQTTLRSLYS